MAKAEIRNHIQRVCFEHRKMTQRALAQRVGCTRQTNIVLEQGRYVLSLLLALPIARVSDAKVEEVFQLED